MAQRAELLAWVPAADKIRLHANVSNPAFPRTKTIAIYVDGKQAGECKLSAENSLFDSGELELPAGFHTILLTVAEKSALPPAADTRELVLNWGRIRFSEPTPTELLLTDAQIDPRVRGLTLDRWMTDKPVEFTLALPGAPRNSLRILGDIPGLDPLFPQTVIASFPGGAKGSVKITKPGEFDVEIPIPAGVFGDAAISLSALKTVSPASISANPDNRPLALRFQGAMIK